MKVFDASPGLDAREEFGGEIAYNRYRVLGVVGVVDSSYLPDIANEIDLPRIAADGDTRVHACVGKAADRIVIG